MRQTNTSFVPLPLILALATPARAATLHASPTGTATTGCSRDTPCDLTSAVSAVAPGDTVILMDGVYKTALDVTTSGTSSAWITFQADSCATPIIEGPGDDVQTTGVGSAGTAKASYLRFIGLVSRGWNTGFGNHWVKTDATPPETPPSNGYLEYKYCIGEGNGRTGFTHYSASGIRVQYSISAHNGGSVAHSWSSGMTLYATSKGTGDALIEGNVSFENMDAERHTDGSGFIVDEESNNAVFINNVAFRNGGSCLRLTTSSNTKFINNTCYHNAQDLQATGPTNPSELYFTNAPTKSGVSFMNNVLVATGTGPGANAVFDQPTSGWSNNTVTTGSASFFKAPDGTNPDFTLASGSTLIGKGASGSGVPNNDIGFDPKCIVKRTPTMIGTIPKGSWWQYSVDIDYIKRIGGVAKCFNPKSRAGTPDIGAYANGTVTTAGTCTPPPQGGTSSSGGTSSAGGSNARGGTTANAGGTASTTTSVMGGSATSTSTTPIGGSTTSANGGAGGATSASIIGFGGSTSTNTSTSAIGDPPPASGSGCGCRLSDRSARSELLTGIGLFAWLALRIKRRRCLRDPAQELRATRK